MQSSAFSAALMGAFFGTTLVLGCLAPTSGPVPSLQEEAPSVLETLEAPPRAASVAAPVAMEIGRASCRERV